ncbi:VCBS repeat-containing protein [Allomuricauda sp. d1]|uniref:VCBS repeat-containing protein n=1 Tax=Allomuricauda sp. d1 TaxID=3136725 RepID=UPI0031E419B8
MLSKICRKPFLVFGTIVLLFGCNSEKEDGFKHRFTLLNSNETGINFTNQVEDSEEHNILKYANFYGGSGVGIGDFNNDGLQDLFFAGNMTPDKLYFNKGNLQFEDVTSKAGINDDGGWSTGVTLADVNNDGHLDIYVSRELYDEKPEWRTNLLYMNNGDGSFTEQAKEFGVANDQRTRHATFFDYNNDGLLDLFLLTQPPNPGSLSQLVGTELLKPEYSVRLYKNEGSSFTDVTMMTGLDKTGFPNAVSASDLNNDGYTDLYVANDFYAPDFLFINNQDGTFTNIANNVLPHMSYYSMGIDVADINNDEQLDVFVLDMVAEDNFRLKSNMSGMDRQIFWDVYDQGGHYQYMFNTLQLNNGNTTFSDVAQFANMAATDWSWANLIADLDNDGHKDVFVTNGLLRDIRNTDADKAVANYVNQTRFDWIKENPDGGGLDNIFDIIDLDTVLGMMPSQPLKNYAFKNKGNLEFEKIAEEWGLDTESFSNGAAYGDLDNDGDLDLVVNNINAPAFIYRNNSDSIGGSNFLRIQLIDENNKTVFGARVTLFSKNGPQTIETTNVRGIYSTSESAVHFGLGEQDKADSISIVWPDGKRSLLKNSKANELIVASHADAKPFQRKNNSKKTLLTKVAPNADLELAHQENVFDDFEVQVLLPHKMSQFGPAMAVGDVNNDGLDDLFFGGATGQPAQLLVQKAKGQFEKIDELLWKKEAPFEDVDAVFLDVNNDGFQDLFVVSGGNEYRPNDFHYTDRLYLNDGNGNFTKGALLNVNRESGSKVVVADYDADGDVDVFVGGRHKPHGYPSAASSTLYRNDNGQLVNATLSHAPELINLGMVTDASWADYDNDDDLDLVLVGEWMPIIIFSNEKGHLKKQALADFEKTKGWWFSLASGDFDADGDIDFLAGNLGLNYKYKTSPEAPFDIYYDDFDGNGSRDIVLGYYSDGVHYPLRGFSCSSEQVPMLKEEFKKYDVFAALDIEQAYGKANLENALHYQVDTFASHYVENLGGGTFKLTKLPHRAQFTNINDFLVRDFNNDGRLDALCIGNLFVSEIETPRNDAGIGTMLLGDRKGGFKALPYSESGFFASKDAKKIEQLNINGKTVITVANNNDTMQFFELN